MARALFVLRNNSASSRANRAPRDRLGRFARENRGHKSKHRGSRASHRKGHRGARRRHSVRHNGIAFRKNGIGLMKNPIGLRANPIGLRANGKGFVGMGLAAIVPVIAGAGALGIIHLGLMAVDWAANQLASYSPAAADAADTVLGYVEPVGYTAGAFAAASLAAVLASVRILPPKWAALFGSIAVIGGAAVDAFRYITTDASPVVAIAPAGATVSGWGDGGAWALGNAGAVHQITQQHDASSTEPPSMSSPTRSSMGAWMTAQR
jgi:hypothetical protein